MYTHILVPLDGSSLAEAALPAVAYLARVFNARVTLLHVIEQDASGTVHGERHLTLPDEAELYLQDVARRAFAPDTEVAYHVHTEATRDVPRTIVVHQAELTPDLIVMCTHGRSGLRKILSGSIAQRVVAFGDLPLLLIHPNPEASQTPFSCDTLLAPTNGDRAHELGLHTAIGLAQVTGAKLHVLSVVPTVGTLSGQQATKQRFLPGTTHALLDSEEEELSVYLQQHISHIEKQGIFVFAEILRGNPATIIVGVAETSGASLIVLGTHCRIGSSAFWNDSVGAKVISQTQRPVLLVPVRNSTVTKSVLILNPCST